MALSDCLHLWGRQEKAFTASNLLLLTKCGPSRSFFFPPLGYTCSFQKLQSQGSNLCHSSDPSSYRDNAESLTHCTTGEHHGLFFFFLRDPLIRPGPPRVIAFWLIKVNWSEILITFLKSLLPYNRTWSWEWNLIRMISASTFNKKSYRKCAPGAWIPGAISECSLS